MNTVTDNWNPEDKLGRKESADFLTNHLIKRYALASKHKQNSWYSKEWRENGAWLRMFQNARKWVG